MKNLSWLVSTSFCVALLKMSVYRIDYYGTQCL